MPRAQARIYVWLFAKAGKKTLAWRISVAATVCSANSRCHLSRHVSGYTHLRDLSSSCSETSVSSCSFILHSDTCTGAWGRRRLAFSSVFTTQLEGGRNP